MSEHPLAAWLKNRMSQAEFARRAGMSPAHLNLVLSGRRGVSLKRAAQIEEATNREVPAASLIQHEAAE